MKAFWLNSFKIVQTKAGLWYLGDSYGVLCGPLGSIEEARDWVHRHYPAQFETKSYHKNNQNPLVKKDFIKIANGILDRQPNLFKKLAE